MLNPLITLSDLFPRRATPKHRLLLCEFARKKENPSLERFIASPFALCIASILQPAEALSTLRSFSAERPVIRGRGRSHALTLLIRSSPRDHRRCTLSTVLAVVPPQGGTRSRSRHAVHACARRPGSVESACTILLLLLVLLLDAVPDR